MLDGKGIFNPAKAAPALTRIASRPNGELSVMKLVTFGLEIVTSGCVSPALASSASAAYAITVPSECVIKSTRDPLCFVMVSLRASTASRSCFASVKSPLNVIPS